MFIVFRKSWAHIFNDDPGMTISHEKRHTEISRIAYFLFDLSEVVSLVATILPLCALFQVFDGTAAVAGGILRAQGKQLTGAALNLSAYYVIGIPFGMLLSFKYHMDLIGLWCGLTVALVYCSVFGTWVALRTDWQHQVYKVEKRLAAERETDRKARLGDREEGT
jgi:MATE family multidrug resistance protein